MVPRFLKRCLAFFLCFLPAMLWFGWRMSGLDVKLLMQEVGSTAAVAGAEAAGSATNSTVNGNPITVPDHTLHNSTKFADGVRSSLTCPTVPLPKVLCATIMGHDTRILQNIKDNVLSPMVTVSWTLCAPYVQSSDCTVHEGDKNAFCIQASHFVCTCIRVSCFHSVIGLLYHILIRVQS
jgi:hypothetical protein